MSIENLIITVFCLVDDLLEEILKEHKLRQRGFSMKLSDSEVITMETVGEFLGFDQDKKNLAILQKSLGTFISQNSAVAHGVYTGATSNVSVISVLTAPFSLPPNRVLLLRIMSLFGGRKNGRVKTEITGTFEVAPVYN